MMIKPKRFVEVTQISVDLRLDGEGLHTCSCGARLTASQMDVNTVSCVVTPLNASDDGPVTACAISFSYTNTNDYAWKGGQK